MSIGNELPPEHGHLQAHIDLIAKHEQEFLAQRTFAERLGDRIASFIGSLSYIALHIAIVSGWIGWNLLPRRSFFHFDSAPFPFLDLLFAFEAILAASFILMRQSRMSRRSDERDHLMLQILLLTEREITAVLGVDRQIAQKMGLHGVASDQEITQLSRETSIDAVAQTIKDSLPTE